MVDDGAHRVAGIVALARAKERCGSSGATDQALRIGQHDRIVPRPLHDKGQLEFIGGCARYQRGNAFKIEIAGRQRGLSVDGKPDRRTDDAHVVDRDHALIDFEADRKLIVRGTAATEITAMV